jgi:hypothetical protein
MMTAALTVLSIVLAIQTVRVWRLKKQMANLSKVHEDLSEANRILMKHWHKAEQDALAARATGKAAIHTLEDEWPNLIG